MILSDGELLIMKLLWEKGDLRASEISKLMEKDHAWKKTSTYTIIKICIEKGYIERREPNFVCHSLLSEQDAQRSATSNFINKIYDGSVTHLFSALLTDDALTKEDFEMLKDMIDKHE